MPSPTPRAQATFRHHRSPILTRPLLRYRTQPSYRLHPHHIPCRELATTSRHYPSPLPTQYPPICSRTLSRPTMSNLPTPSSPVSTLCRPRALRYSTSCVLSSTLCSCNAQQP